MPVDLCIGKIQTEKYRHYSIIASINFYTFKFLKHL